jgi:hypothetical protein
MLDSLWSIPVLWCQSLKWIRAMDAMSWRRISQTAEKPVLFQEDIIQYGITMFIPPVTSRIGSPAPEDEGER